MPKQKTLMLLFTACLALLALAACSSATVEQPQLACWPAAGEVTGEYGWTRLGWRTGMQMQLAEAAPVQSAAAGEVVSVEQDAAGDTVAIEIDHGHKLRTRYALCGPALVAAGDEVQAGTVIAESGELFFSVRWDDVSYDPRDFLPEEAAAQ